MTNRFEQRYVIDLAGRIASGIPAHLSISARTHKHVAKVLTICLKSHGIENSTTAKGDDLKRKDFKNRETAEATWAKFHTGIKPKTARKSRIAPDRLEKNISELAAHVSLNEDEEKIFHLAVRAASDEWIGNVCTSLTYDAELSVEATLVLLTGISPSRVRKALSPAAKLTACGLVQYAEPSWGGIDIDSGLGVTPPNRLLSAMEPPSRGLSDIMDRLFATVSPATVSWDDFDHLGPRGALIFRILQGALETREKGVNILLHGVPGTGKTEFCKVLGERLGARLLGVGESNDDDDEPSRQERLQQLRLAQRMFSGHRNTVILFDEMEDLLKGGYADTSARQGRGGKRRVARADGSKVHMNRLFETNAVPTLWTTNDIDSCDPAFLRRITLVLELRTPPVNVRARIWRRLAKQHDVPLSREQCLEFAKSMRDAPALANSALRTARIARGGVDDVKLAASALARAVRGGRLPPPATGGHERFDPHLANADHDLDMVTRRIVASWAKAGNGVVGAVRANGTDNINVADDDGNCGGNCGGNRDSKRRSSVGGVGVDARGVIDASGIGGLCLSGAPGTGKSAFGRYLADRLEMQVLERRASDILSCFVGGTEHMIADAFAEARETGAFLIFDEVDSLLGSREHATQSWELSQVNEMLTWMESHPLPFACTTNLRGRLDAATVRRFALHIDFRPLSLAQRRACFKRFFSCAPAEGAECLAAFDKLTPGDFAVVAKRVNLLGLTDSRDIVAELRRVQETKPGGGVAMGFSAAA